MFKFTRLYLQSPCSLLHNDPTLGGYTLLFKFTWLYLQSPCSLLHNDPTLGAIRCCSSLHDHIYKVPAHYCIMTRPLGATLVEVFMSIRQLQVLGCCKHDNPTLEGYKIWNIQFLLVTGMNNMDFFKIGSIYIEASLKPSLCSAQDMGATCIILLSEKYFQILCLEQTRLTRCHQ